MPTMLPNDLARSRLITARGARAVESALLEHLAGLLPGSPEELQPPIRIVVPSRSLRLHLTRRLVQWRGSALAGLVIQTLFSTALEICERAGCPATVADTTHELLIRRLAAAEPCLRDGLGFLTDGYAGVVSTVRDLLDAGFEPALEEPLHDQLASLAGGYLPMPVIDRAAALVRIAARVSEAATGLGAVRTSDLLRRATGLLRQDPAVRLPSRAVLVVGFADATGTVSDLIETVVRTCPATVLVEQPPDPLELLSGGDLSAPDWEFSRPLLERLAGVASLQPAPGAPPQPRVSATVAPSREEEVRAVARQLRQLLDDGTVRPESVAVVARDLRRYASPLRRHLDRLGIPFSGVGATVAAGQRRRQVMALLALLRRRHQLPADRFLEAAAPELAGTALLALRAFGVARLDDLATLDLQQLAADQEAAAEQGSLARQHELHPAQLEELVTRAGVCREALGSWPETAVISEHLDCCRQLLLHLGWSQASDWYAAVMAAASRLASQLPDQWPITDSEWQQQLALQLEPLTEQPIGGRGGGVQLLSVMEARSRTFPVLLLLGLNRDLFPRLIREDPLLPDTIRGQLAVVLPDIPIKTRGWAEEQYLFAQLIAAAEQVHLSWFLSDGGQPVAPSPFAERLSLEAGIVAVPAPDRWQRAAPAGDSLRPASEHVLWAGLGGDRQTWRVALQAALEEGRARVRQGLESATVGTGIDPQAVAYRHALLDELDPEIPRPAASAFAGCLGGGADRVWPETLWVTELERVAICPWQAFVSRVLEITPAADPLIELPGPAPQLVGALVHRVLQRIVQEQTGGGGAVLWQALLSPPIEVAWPPPEKVEQLLGEEAAAVARQAGLITRPEVPAMLFRVATPLLELAHGSDWQGGAATVPAVGAEVNGSLEVAGRTVSFRADRVDLPATGPRLTDYKTGSPAVARLRTEAGRHRRTLQELSRGRLLQAVSYAIAAGGDGACGRYLYLRPDRDPDAEGAAQTAAELVVTAEETALVAAYEAAMTVLIAAVDSGCCFPRVEEAGAARPGWWCRSCAVRQACLRDDSGFRRRLVAWMDRYRAVAARRDLGPAEAAATALWWIGAEQ